MKTNTLVASLLFLAVLYGAVYFIYLNERNMICVKQTPSGTTDNGCVSTPCTCPTCATETAVRYVNKDYGFDVALPDSWKGYSIATENWQGYSIADASGQKLVAEGPQLSVRHPLWTNEKPRQDIPVMVFTLAQWDDMSADKFHIGAAPINPSELGRNNKYVFALPARYNFAFPEGYEEVDHIMAGSPLHAFDI